MNNIHQLTTTEKIIVCKAEIEHAKAYRDYYHDFNDELEAAWNRVIKRLTNELYALMDQQKREAAEQEGVQE